MKKLLFSIAMMISFNIASIAQLPDSIKAHIDSSLNILKDHSLYAGRVNWPQVTANVYKKAQLATNKEQTFEALKIAFDALGDKHAMYYQFNDSYRLPNTEWDSRITDSIRTEWARGPRVKKQMIGNIAYLGLPFMGVQKQAAIDEHAGWIYSAITELLKHEPKGWIIDLRVNGGGNIRPMLAGIAPFFEEGAVSYYINREGNAEEESAFVDGNFTIGGVQQATIKKRIPPIPKAKIAVLIGPGTASSGEGVALALKQRTNTRLFGTRSAGLANSTNGFIFNNDNSYFLISTASIGDRRKRVLPEFIEPDEIVEGGESFLIPEKDKVVIEAIKWLNR